jgi:DNA-binding HxlR family transcriptional regulator
VPGLNDPVAGRLQAGGHALLLLADPVSVSILRQLAPGPTESTELLERIGFASRSTYFERMRDLEDLSLVERTRRGDVPPIAECRLARHGERLLPVATHLEAWLADAPEGPLKLGDAYATATVKALAVAWGSALLRWLAEEPRTLTELEQLVQIFGYRKLERILRELAKTGLVERLANGSRSSPYAVTDWARRTAGPLTAAMRWERHEIAKRSASITWIEAEGVLLLALPLVELPDHACGTCALLVDPDAPRTEGLGGAVVRLSNGRPVSWSALEKTERGGALQRKVDCWVRGPALAWFGTQAKMPGLRLRTGGDTVLAKHVMAALREVSSRSRPLMRDRVKSTP